MTAWRLRYAPHLGIVDPARPYFRHSAGGDPADQIAHAASLGFPAVCDNGLLLRPPEQRRRMREALSAHGMALSSYVDHPDRPTSLWTRTDAASVSALRDRLARALDAGAALSAAHLTIVAIADGGDAAGQMTRMAGNLGWAAPLAGEFGIVLALEAVSPRRLPGVLVSTVDQAGSVIRASGAGNVRLLFDCMHVAMESGNVAAAFARVAPLVGLIQLSDLSRMAPEPDGDCAALLRAAVAAGYDGVFELEHMHGEASAAGEKASLRKLAAIDAMVD